ncbi:MULTISPECIES: hypothetical protein [unclassified Mycobacterium]|uniref:hypothetical protein n=1 Tax=unclassified Mycobacterium TaxID=2642494 RepID=UPI0009EF6304|nr:MULTISPECIES: hypothetical protein [unclassified Mycobacterium]
MGDLPPNFGGEPPNAPPPSQWQPPYPPAPSKRPRTWPAIALASIAVLLGAVALVVAATRSTNDSAPGSPTTSAAPTYTAAESAAAHRKLCDIYNVAARAVQIDTNGDNPAYAGIATVNGAVTLEHAVNSAPALPPGDRAAALALAEAYSNAQVLASLVQRDDPAWRSAADDVNAKDTAMKSVCGGG